MLLMAQLPLSLYLLIKFLKQDTRKPVRYRYLIFACIVVGASILTKAVMFYFPIFIMVFIAVYWRKSMRKMLITFLLATITIALVVSPWVVRNYLDFSYIVYTDETGFLQPNKELIADKFNSMRKRTREGTYAIDEAAIRYFFGTGTSTLFFMYDRTHNAAEYYRFVETTWESRRMPRQLKGRLLSFWNHLYQYSPKIAALEFLLLSIVIATYIFSAMGFFQAFRNGKARESVIFMLGTMYFSLIILVAITTNSAYRVPSVPFYTIFAGYGLWECKNLFRRDGRIKNER